MCNPLNLNYQYQFVELRTGRAILREAADPSLILFKDKYYLFPSMAAGFFTSFDLIEWTFHELYNVPIYDYAPDVRVVGEYIYFSASSTSICSFYRSKDPIGEGFEKIEGTFPFWDPNLFEDQDGALYLYWGCSNVTPIFGVELDPKTMKPKGEAVGLITANDTELGYERNGEHHILTKTPEQVEDEVNYYIENNPSLTPEQIELVRLYMQPTPFLEGPWMTKNNGRYYLQYAVPDTMLNVYGDGVYVSDNPLGPFEPAKNNPYSYKPGGFITGAGHGSTMRDIMGNIWHTASLRISKNSNFERRLGLWPAGFDGEGELFCNQRYGDWPMKIDGRLMNPWEAPEWMLLSYKKPTKSSSYTEAKDAMNATDEDIRTWWKAATNKSGEWIEVDLQQECDVRAIQINFADDKIEIKLPTGAVLQGEPDLRYIDMRKHCTRWLLEGSLDGKEYFVIEDKSTATTDLAHDLTVREEGLQIRFIRCTIIEVPYQQNPCISGLRVFGTSPGNAPEAVADVEMFLITDLDLHVKWQTNNDTVGYNVLWGFEPGKLYHGYMIFAEAAVTIGAMIKGQPVYVRVDAFNECGITEGKVNTVEIKKNDNLN